MLRLSQHKAEAWVRALKQTQQRKGWILLIKQENWGRDSQRGAEQLAGFRDII